MIEGPPPLTEEWMPQPFRGATSQGGALVELIASEPLSWDDLWRIRATADWRVVRSRRTAEQMEREIVLLEGAVRDLKNRDAANQMESDRLRLENASLRSSLNLGGTR